MTSDLLPSKDRIGKSDEPLKDDSSDLNGFVVIVILLVLLQLLMLLIGALVCLGSKLLFFIVFYNEPS
jgi:hypothetical protein